MNDNWKNDPTLQGIDPAKLILLQKLAEGGLGKSPSELMSYLIQLKTGNQNLTFKSEEINTIINVLKAGKSPQECAKLDRMIQLMSMIK